MASFTVGTLWTGGCAYTCTISYDTPTRSGDKVKIKNVKATITSASQYQTQNRIAVSVDINGVSKAYNKTVLYANDTTYPSSKEVTIIDSNGYEFTRLENWFYIDVTFKSTGYGDSWDSDFGHASTDDWDNRAWLSCPARTYPITFALDGGSWSGTAPSQAKTYNTNLTITSSTPDKSGFDFNGWSGSDGNIYLPGSTYATNADLTLTAVWRAQQSDLDPVEDTEIGSNPSFTWTPQSSSLTYKLVLSLGTWTWTSEVISPGSESEYTYDSKVIPMEVCNQLPTQTEGVMQADLETYNGNTKTGTSTRYFTVSVPEDVVPEFDTITIGRSPENALHLFLQNLTSVDATAYITKAYGSEIAEAKMTIGEDVTIVNPDPPLTPGYTIANLTSGLLSVSGEVTITFTATDYRGRTATATETITVYEYERPYAVVTVTKQQEGYVHIAVAGHYSSVEGLNAATFTLNGGSSHAVDNEHPSFFSLQHDTNKENFEAAVVVTDAVTFSISVAYLYPGRGDRFDTLSEDDFYVGMDDKGWKNTESEYEGGIEDGVISFTRWTGEDPAGVGVPIQMEPDTDYELVYSVNRADDSMSVFVSFFEETDGTFTYLSNTYTDDDYMHSGEIFHTPEPEEGTLWGIVVFGDKMINNTREYSDVVIRKIEQSEESFTWEMETGVLGLDTPNQKYISRIQMRIDYVGSLKVEIAYNNESSYTTVHESVCEYMRSITVPIKVKRSDHFRTKLSGTGQARLYSFGFQTDEGGARCLI